LAKSESSLSDAVHGAAQAGQHNSSSKVPSRSGKGVTKAVLLRLPLDLHRKMRQLALDEDTTLQMLGLEALRRLLENRQR